MSRESSAVAFAGTLKSVVALASLSGGSARTRKLIESGELTGISFPDGKSFPRIARTKQERIDLVLRADELRHGGMSLIEAAEELDVNFRNLTNWGWALKEHRVSIPKFKIFSNTK